MVEGVNLVEEAELTKRECDKCLKKVGEKRIVETSRYVISAWMRRTD